MGLIPKPDLPGAGEGRRRVHPGPMQAREIGLLGVRKSDHMNAGQLDGTRFIGPAVAGSIGLEKQGTQRVLRLRPIDINSDRMPLALVAHLHMAMAADCGAGKIARQHAGNRFAELGDLFAQDRHG